MTKIRTLTICAVVLVSMVGHAPAGRDISVSSQSGRVSIANGQLKLEFDLSKGTYDAVDLRDGVVCISNAHWTQDNWSSRDPGVTHKWRTEDVDDELGRGKALIITSTKTGLPDRILKVVLYPHCGFVAMAMGLDNKTDATIHLKTLQPLADGEIFPGLDKNRNFRLLDGYSGGEPLEWGAKEYTAVHKGTRVHSRNNLLVTFGENQSRRSLVIGGLTYADYEKFAHIRQPRRTELEIGPDGRHSLLCYLNLGTEKIDTPDGKPSLKLIKGQSREHSYYGRFWCPEFSTTVYGKDGVVLEATRLDKHRSCWLGFSWWNMDRRVARKADRIQSISVDGGPQTPRITLLDRQTLPMWSNPKKQQPHQAEIKVPGGVCVSGRMRIFIESQSDDDPSAVISEIWLRDGTARPLLPALPTAIDQTPRPRRRFSAQLYAEDPVGKRIDPGARYMPEDRFYLDFITRNPFEALEQYGRKIRKAQNIHLNMYDFPTVCLWYAHHRGYGGGKATNDTPGAVAEIEQIARTGFLKYSRAAVRLVPDSYTKNSEQGWWDDAHFQKYGSSNLGDFKGGHYKAPYETSKKWGKAVTERGGIPLIYFQTSFRSEDYAEAFPGHMLFNKTRAWKNPSRTIPPDNESFWASPWARRSYLWSYDYTDPGFIQHLRRVYANLRSGGIKGLMFDYPASGWASGGGMEDLYSTTAAAYRNIFRLAYEGLGPDCWIHERNMERGSDITLGLVASQRTENDTDRISPGVVTRCGLRWYKNRIVINYDTDSKNLLRARSRDGIRSLLTMSYVTTGRLLLANSFSQLSPEIIFDLTRIYPFHTTPLTARPVDAFTQKYPRIYDFRISPQWHQLTFYNTSNREEVDIPVKLSADTAEGGLGLNPSGWYHVYDFWNGVYIGKLPGSGTLTQKLRPDEARMMSIHEMVDHPQFISTNRHVMQGYVDLKDVCWDPRTKQLKGSAQVVGGETYRIVLATNGYQATGCSVSCRGVKAQGKIESLSLKDNLVQLSIDVAENSDVTWVVSFR